MNKRLIRLTESDLHRIVKEAVDNLLSDDEDPTDELEQKVNVFLRNAYDVMKEYEEKYGEEIVSESDFLSGAKSDIKNLYYFVYGSDLDRE